MQPDGITCVSAEQDRNLPIGGETVPPSHTEPQWPQPFSIFTKPQKGWIILVTVLAGMFSALASGLIVSVELVNLMITSILVSGLAPTRLGNAADRTGRRPVYILAMSIHVVANFGLASQSSFTTLFLLRIDAAMWQLRY